MRWHERMLDFAPLVLFGIDDRRTLAFVMGRDAKLLFGDEPERLLGRSTVELAAELDATWLPAELDRALSGDEHVGGGPVGQRLFEVRYGVVRDERRGVTGVLCVASDVTDRRSTEAAQIARATSLLRATLNATDDGMFTVDVAGNVGFINQRFLDMWHLTEEVMRLPDFRQRMSFILSQLKDPASYQELAKEFYAHPERPTFHVLEFSDGRTYERYSHPQWVDGVCVGRVLSFRDVTKERRAERERDQLLVEEQAARLAAEQAERRAAFLAEAATLLASSLNYDETLIAAARRAVPVLADGCIACTIEDDQLRCLEATHLDPEKREATRALGAYYGSLRAGAPAARALVSGEPLLVAEVDEAWLAHHAPDAEHRALLAALGLRSFIVVSLVARGHVLGALVLLATHDSRSYGPPELALALELARRAAVAIDNARLYRQAERAVRARDEFLAVASHELRTPLTSLHLNVQHLLSLSDNTPPELMGKLRSIERQGKRLERLVGALLDVSRSGSGTLTLKLDDEVDLSKLAVDLVSVLGVEQRGAEQLVSVIAPRPVVGRWDRMRLEQVLGNLLSNALRHGAGKPITVRVEAGAADAVLSVRDQGGGIAPELLARVFEKFERGTLSHSYGGLGLGLYISQQIVEAHRGTITAESELGAGATFTVKLPRSP